MFKNLKWKKTSQGQYISLFSSSEITQFRPKEAILVIGGVHGDEPEGIFLAESLLEWLKGHNQGNKISEENKTLTPWVIIPCLNPDGFQNKTRVNGNGVDINRNFPSKDWSTEFKEPRYYPGKSPGSEVETQAILEILSQVKPRMIIHCHSWKPAIVYTGEEAQSMAQILSEVSGYNLQPDIGYPTPGSLGQYGWLNEKTGVICTEEREGASKEETWNRFKKGFEKIFFNTGQ